MRKVLPWLFLWIGIMIYLCGRGENHPVSQIVVNLGFEEEVHYLSTLGRGWSWNSWVLYSLPDGLCTFAFVGFVLQIWDYEIGEQSLWWILAFLGIALVHELLQLYFAFLGSFDIADVITIVLSAEIALILLSKSIWYENIQSQ